MPPAWCPRSPPPQCQLWKEAAASTIWGPITITPVIINTMAQADRTSLTLAGGEAAACYCAGQIRRNKSPVLSSPKAPRRMEQSCSSMTCHKHEGKHAGITHSREAAVAYVASGNLPNNNWWHFTSGFFYCSIKWHVSCLPAYFLTLQGLVVEF